MEQTSTQHKRSTPVSLEKLSPEKKTQKTVPPESSDVPMEPLNESKGAEGGNVTPKKLNFDTASPTTAAPTPVAQVGQAIQPQEPVKPSEQLKKVSATSPAVLRPAEPSPPDSTKTVEPAQQVLLDMALRKIAELENKLEQEKGKHDVKPDAKAKPKPKPTPCRSALAATQATPPPSDRECGEPEEEDEEEEGDGDGEGKADVEMIIMPSGNKVF